MAEVGILRLKVDASGAVTGFAQFDAAAKRSDQTVKSYGESLGKQGGSLRSYGQSYAAMAAVVAGSTAIIGAAFRKMLQEAHESRAALGMLTATVKSTGGAAGLSVRELRDYADALERVSNYSSTAVQGGLSRLLAYTAIQGPMFKEATAITLDMAAALGIELTSAAEKVGNALNYPTEAINSLTRQGFRFTDQQKELIKYYEETGQVAKAQAIILAELKLAYEGQSAAAREASGGLASLKNHMEHAAEAGGNALAPAINKLAGQLAELLGRREVVDLVTQFGQAAGDAVTLVSGLVGGVLELAGAIRNLVSAAIPDRVAAFYEAILPGNFVSRAAPILLIINKLAEGMRALGDARAWLTEKVTGYGGMSPEEIGTAANAQATERAATAAEKLRLKEDDLTASIIKQRDEMLKRYAAFGKQIPAMDAAAAAADRLRESQERLHKTHADAAEKRVKEYQKEQAKSIVADMGKVLDSLKAQQAVIKSAMTDEEKRNAILGEALRLRSLGVLTEAQLGEVMRDNSDKFEVQVAQATEWGEAIKNANENALRGIQSAFAGFFKTLLTDGKLTWKELGKGLIDVFASVVSELLARWIVLELKKTAETIRQAAVRAAAERAGSVAGGGSSAGAGSALSGAGSAAGGAGGGGGGVAGTGVSGTALAGAAVIAFALFVVYKAFIEKSERWASVNLRTGEATGNSGRVKDQIRARLGAIYKAIEEVTKEFDLAMTKLGDVTITKRGGQYSVSGLGGIMTQVFKTGEEAMEYAAVMAIRFGEFAEGVSEFMQAIVRGSQAVTMDALRADLALGREVERLGQSGTEAAIRSGVAHFDELRAAMVRLIKDSALLAQALDKINKAEIELFASERDRITGRQKNAKEEFEDRKRQAVLWNAERALRIANINLMILETKAKIQMMLVSMALLAQWNGRTGGGGPGYGEGGTGRGPGGPGTGDGGVPNPYQPYKGGTGEGPYKPPRPGEGTGNAQLDGLYAFLDSLMAILGSLPGAIDPNEVRPGRGNRQARRDAQQGLRDEAAMFGKSDIAIQLAETALWLTEFAKRVKEAGFNAAESAAMMASAEAEAARRREEIKQDVLGRAKDFIGPGAGGSLGKALADVGKQSADLIADLRELRAAGQLTGTEFQSLAASITRAAAAARAGLFEDAKNDLFLQLYDALGMEKEAAEFRFRMAVAEMRIKIEELRIAGRIYGLNVDFLGELQLLVNEFERRGPVYPGSPAVAPGTHGSRNGEIMQSGGHNWRWVTSDPVYNMGYWDDLGPVAPESGPRVDPDWLARQNAPSGYEALAKDRKSLLGRLAGYEELRFDPITRGLRALNQEFAEMRAEAVRLQVPLAKVNEAYTLALNDWWKNTLQGVREFRDSMALAPTSSLTGAQQFTASRDSFRESLSALRGGDLSQISRITQLGSQYMTQGQQATGGEAYRFIEREVRDAMTSILGLAPPTALPTGAATAPMYMEAPTVVTAINTASNAQMIAIQNAAVVQVATLREMQTVLSDIESHTADTAYNTAETVVSLRSVA